MDFCTASEWKELTIAMNREPNSNFTPVTQDCSQSVFVLYCEYKCSECVDVLCLSDDLFPGPSAPIPNAKLKTCDPSSGHQDPRVTFTEPRNGMSSPMADGEHGHA